MKRLTSNAPQSDRRPEKPLAPLHAHPLTQIRRALGSQAGGRFIQAMLTVSQPGDPYEQEADRVADQVMRTPDQTAPATVRPGGLPQISRLQRMCAQCEEEEIQRQPMEEEEEEETLQAKESPGQTPEIASGVRTQIESLRSGGEPLPGPVRSFFEPRFGRDFSQVRVHAGGEAASAARAAQARAYTIGRNIVFGSGEYEPATVEGRRLLAHELVHTIQQAAPAPAGGRQELKDTEAERRGDTISPRVLGDAPHNISPATESIARKGSETSSAGSTVGYVAIYLGGGQAYIDFHTNKGMFRYRLDEIGKLKAGEYQSSVVVKGNDVDFTLDIKEGELFGFSYSIDPGQPNPKTFFAKQSSVTFTVTEDEAPPIYKSDEDKEEKEDQDPNVTYLTVEEALRRCESGDLPGVKVFPYRGTRFGPAPLTVFRDGEDIVVKSYVYVFANNDFKKQTRTLPTETFIGGVRLKPNEIVRVHTYEPRWYHLNITGSTSGDIEEEFCVTGEQMLKIGEMSDSAVKMNIALTVVDAATFFIPVGKLASIIGKPVVQFVSRGGRTLAAAMMLGLREAAPTAFTGIASRTGTVLIQEQVVDQVASRAISQTASHAAIEFGEHSLGQVAKSAATDVVGEVGSGAAKEALARTVTVTFVDAAGRQVVSTVTTPTGDAALDKAINEAFDQTFDTSASQATGAAAQQGVVSVAPEITAGFTQAQVAAFRRVLAKSFDSNDIRVLQQLWDAAARPGDAAILNAGNSRYLFDLHRNRFWRAVAANPQARALFTDAGCQFSGGAPYYMLNGRRITMTIDHIVERQTAPNLALSATNLRIAFSRENSVVLRLLNQLDPFQ